MNHCPLGSQGARGQLSTGSPEPLDFAAADRSENFSAELPLRRFPCTSRHGPSDAMGNGWPGVRGWSGWATHGEGFGEWDGEIGVGLSVAGV